MATPMTQTTQTTPLATPVTRFHKGSCWIECWSNDVYTVSYIDPATGEWCRYTLGTKMTGFRNALAFADDTNRRLASGGAL